MKNKHILSIKDLSIKDITDILTKAEKFLNKKTKKKILFQIKILLIYFLKTLQELLLLLS